MRKYLLLIAILLFPLIANAGTGPGAMRGTGPLPSGGIPSLGDFFSFDLTSPAENETLRIDSSGNVVNTDALTVLNNGVIGIGIASPLGTGLHIEGSTNAQLFMSHSGADANKKLFSLTIADGVYALKSRLDDNSNPGGGGDIWSVIKDVDGDVDYQIWSTGSPNNLERIRLDQDGNFGLNTATFGTSAVSSFVIGNGTLGDPAANMIQMASEDNGAGNASLLIQPEQGAAFRFGNGIFDIESGALTLGSTSADLTLQTTTSGDILFKPASNSAGVSVDGVAKLICNSTDSNPAILELQHAGTGKWQFQVDSNGDYVIRDVGAANVITIMDGAPVDSFQIEVNGDNKVGEGTKHDGFVTRVAAEVQTIGSGQTTADSITLLDENTYHVEAYIVGVQDDGTDRCSYHIAGTVYRTGAGTATLQGTVTSLHTQESNASCDATLTVNSNDIRVSVTGIAAETYEWGCTMKYMNMSN